MRHIGSLNEIDTTTSEGRYLMAAIAKITGESQTDKTPDEVLEQLSVLSRPMHTEDDPFVLELERLINKHSKENQSNTPDFVLAAYLNRCLVAYGHTEAARDAFYGDRRDD